MNEVLIDLFVGPNRGPGGCDGEHRFGPAIRRCSRGELSITAEWRDSRRYCVHIGACGCTVTVRTAVRGLRRLAGICEGPGAGAGTRRFTWIVGRGGGATFAQESRAIRRFVAALRLAA